VEEPVEKGAEGNVLYELAQVMATNDGLSAAVALRKLAQAGYGSLEDVDSASDWALLSIPGLGVGRLGAVRRLTRSDWRPASPQAVKAVSRFFSAARLALRFWPLEVLTSLIQNSAPVTVNDGPIEKRLAIDMLSRARRKALCYCGTEELVWALQQMEGKQDKLGRRTKPAAPDPSIADEQPATRQASPVAHELPVAPSNGDSVTADSDRFAHPRHKRLEIVQEYWDAREKCLVQNKDSWARSHYHISGKTLLSYEREFQDQKHNITVS
jgi:hypothetical protein